MATAEHAQTEWLTDIGKACEELGVGIKRLEVDSITLLIRGGGSQGTVVTVEAYNLSGHLLRKLFRPMAER